MIKALPVVRSSGTQIANDLKTQEIMLWYPEVGSGEEILLVDNENYLREEGQKNSVNP